MEVEDDVENVEWKPHIYRLEFSTTSRFFFQPLLDFYGNVLGSTYNYVETRFWTRTERADVSGYRKGYSVLSDGKMEQRHAAMSVPGLSDLRLSQGYRQTRIWSYTEAVSK